MGLLRTFVLHAQVRLAGAPVYAARSVGVVECARVDDVNAWRSLTFRRVLALSTLPGVVLFAAALAGGEQGLLGNIASEALGLSASIVVVSWVLDQRQRAAERARISQVERRVLESIFRSCLDIARLVAELGQRSDLLPDERGPLAARADVSRLLAVIQAEGLTYQLSVADQRHGFDFLREMLDSIARLQQAFPYVIEHHQELAFALSDLILQGDRLLTLQRMRGVLTGRGDPDPYERRSQQYAAYLLLTVDHALEAIVSHLVYISSEQYFGDDGGADAATKASAR